MKFDKMEGVRDYLIAHYPKAKGKSLAMWITSDVSSAIGVYEGEDLIKGIMIYKDSFRDQWILLDSLPADLAVRNFIEYRNEFDEAIELFELLEEFDEEEENDEDIFFSDLD